MDAVIEKRGAEALRAYVSGESSEPVVLSEFRGIALEERSGLILRHRDELAAIDGARLLIAESMLLPLEHRRG
ncbi:MAG TPA: hypothetical protein VNX21_06190 [Candidatus Thermoplasmatota archaeon]|nr:hypothetical protein [Candidatus Thermoplasmatota archaeon]